MNIYRHLIAVFAVAFIACSSQAIAQDADYKIYELFYNNLADAESLANKNDAFAQHILGIAYEFGDGVDVDLSRAVDLYVKSAENGYGLAQYHLSELYFDGGLLPINLTKGTNWLKKASDQKVPGAMYELSRFAAFGERGYYLNKDLAYKLCVENYRLFEHPHCALSSDLEKKAKEEAGYIGTVGAKNISVSDEKVHEKEFDAHDWFNKYLYFVSRGYRATKVLLKSVSKGSGRAADTLGRLYEDLGEHQKALDWYKKGAGLGAPAAMYRLANIYSRDRRYTDFVAVSIDHREAAKYRLLGALSGFPATRRSTFLLAHKHLKNQEALLRKSAEAGNAYALYEISSNAETDKQRMVLLEKAADRGYLDAIFKLSKNYRKGRYVSQNYTIAYKWALIGLMAKPASPEKIRKGHVRFAEVLDKASINAAQRMATDWLKEHPNFME
jgi:TPR repeat protein